MHNHSNEPNLPLFRFCWEKLFSKMRFNLFEMKIDFNEVYRLFFTTYTISTNGGVLSTTSMLTRATAVLSSLAINTPSTKVEVFEQKEAMFIFRIPTFVSITPEIKFY